MYACSSDFKNAVKNNAHQIALLIFENAVFDNEDIDMDEGITFKDNFNLEEDLAIGQTPSNELSFTLLNDGDRLKNFSFGTFTATIGAQIDTGSYSSSANVYIKVGAKRYEAYSSRPYLRMNGSALASQPASAVKSLLYYNGIVYAFTDSVTYSYKHSDGSQTTNSVPGFMRKKAVNQWDGKGIVYGNNRILTLYEDGETKTYECVPLGVFVADRPNVADEIGLSFACKDQMSLFDDDMPTDKQLNITYPVTLRQLFLKLCSYVGVTGEAGTVTQAAGTPTGTLVSNAQTEVSNNTFINGNATIDKRPEAFDDATMRKVLGWIAECACANVRFDRDGVLQMAWLKSASLNIDENNYAEFHPYWYTTPAITKVSNRTTSNGAESSKGSGKQTYLILDNPLMKEG